MRGQVSRRTIQRVNRSLARVRDEPQAGEMDVWTCFRKGLGWAEAQGSLMASLGATAGPERVALLQGYRLRFDSAGVT